MGLNLNRGTSIKYYSSDRLSSLIANGLLTFLQKGYFYEDFFEDKRDVLFFNNAEDLRDYIIYYSKNFKERSLIASNGKKVFWIIWKPNSS